MKKILRLSIVVFLLFFVLFVSRASGQESIKKFCINKVTRETKTGRIHFLAIDGRGNKYFRFVTRSQVEAFKYWFWTVQCAAELEGKNFYGASFGQAFHAIEFYWTNMSTQKKLANLLAIRIWEKIDAPMPDQPTPIRITKNDFTGNRLSSEIVGLINQRLEPITGGYIVIESVEIPQGKILSCEITCAAALKIHHKTIEKIDSIVIVTDDLKHPIIF